MRLRKKKREDEESKKVLQPPPISENHPAHESAGFWTEYGRTLMHLGKLVSAKESFRRALRIDPRIIEALECLGIVHTQLSELDEAEDTFRKVIYKNPDDEFGYILLGLFAIQNQRTPILDEWLSSRKLDRSKFSGVWYWWACGFFFNCEFKEAEKLAMRSFSLSSTEPDTWLIKACCQMRLNRRDDAKQAFDQFKSLYPDAKGMNLGKIANVPKLDRKGKPRIVMPRGKEAKLVKLILPDLLVLDSFTDRARPSGTLSFGLPENHEMWCIRGATFRTISRYRDARHAFRKVLEDDPEEPPPLDIYQLLSPELRKMAFQKLRHLKGKARIMNERFFLLMRHGSHADAMAAILSAEMLAPGTYMEKVGPTMRFDPKTGAVEPLRVAERVPYEEISRSPFESEIKDITRMDFTEVLYYGKVHLRERNFTEAEKAFRRATELNSRSSEAWKGLGDSLIRLHRYEEAGNAWKKAKSLE